MLLGELVIKIERLSIGLDNEILSCSLLINGLESDL